MQFDWIYQYDLFLFDFDGVLVNTEYLHYLAYQNMMLNRGLNLQMEFDKWVLIAHKGAHCIKEAIYSMYPNFDPDWNKAYEEKKAQYFHLISQKPVELLPGVEALLLRLKDANIRRCVVTNSLKTHVDLITLKQPVLQTIPNWITREMYEFAKPHPGCYIKAKMMYAKPGDSIIGFEDSLKGFEALKHIECKAVLMNQKGHFETLFVPS